MNEHTTLHPESQARPDAEHIAVHRQQARMMADEELHSWRSDATWRVQLAAVDDESPEHVNANSRIDALAVIAAVNGELQWRAERGVSKPASSLGWPKDFIEAVKAANPVEAHVARHVALTKQGQAFVGRCPFHDDSTPSLVVWPDSGRFKCFGCHLGGDIVTWTQAIARISFREAVEALADLAGMELPKLSSRQHRLEVRT